MDGQPQTTCSIEACDRASVVRGWCRMHYQRWRDHGDPARDRPTTTLRIAARTLRTPTCWLWQGATSRGYGVVKVEGRTVKVTRTVWEEAYGPIPRGLSLLHSCDTPACVRLDHLMLGTQRANIQDMLAKGRRPQHRAA